MTEKKFEAKPEPEPKPPEVRLASKLASVKFVEKIAREAGLKNVAIGVFDGGTTIRIGSRNFPAADIEAMVRQDEKSADAVVRRALGIK